MDSSQLKPLVMLVALLALAGCASAPKSSVRVVEPRTELASVIGNAPQGAQVQLEPGNSLGVDTVIVGRTYFAASARECRRLKSANGSPIRRVACKDKDGVWRFARDLSVSSSSNSYVAPALNVNAAQVGLDQTTQELIDPDQLNTANTPSILVDAAPLELTVAESVVTESLDNEVTPAAIVVDSVEIPAAFQESSAIPLIAPEQTASQSIPYAVEINETLWSFAKRTTGNALNWQAIAETNGIDNAKTLASGTVLNVPAALVSRGD